MPLLTSIESGYAHLDDDGLIVVPDCCSVDECPPDQYRRVTYYRVRLNSEAEGDGVLLVPGRTGEDEVRGTFAGLQRLHEQIQNRGAP